jgi:hypothetical protein
MTRRAWLQPLPARRVFWSRRGGNTIFGVDERDERDKRLGMNEALYREVNERVAGVAEQFIEIEGNVSPVHFNCECGDPDCTEQIEMTLPDYEHIRSEPNRFVVASGHERPEIERVVDRQPAYLVVEKHDPEAEGVALKTDPRGS